MNRISMPLCALLFLVLGCNAGCSISPNLLTLSKEGITAHGSTSSKGDQIDSIDIDPYKLSSDDRQRLWIGFSTQQQISLQSITEDRVKQISIPASHYYPQYSYSHALSSSYYADGYAFEFENGHFTKLLVNRYGWPPKDITALVNIGSRKGPSLKLPCSLDDFEKVFGKTKIRRAYYE